mgnify:CR=1 FL=1
MPIMLTPVVSSTPESSVFLKAGAVLLRRGDASDPVLHLLQGRVVLGFLQQGEMLHQLGEVEGPCWLEASSGLLGLAHVVDAVALTPVHLHQVAVSEFMAQVEGMPDPSQALLMDMAKQQRQLVRRDAVMAEAKSIMARLAGRLDQLPDELAALVPDAQLRSEIVVAIRQGIDNMRRDVARWAQAPLPEEQEEIHG